MKGLRHGTFSSHIPKNGGYMLDLFPGASSAYSTRLLTQSYAGACLRVRRESDNAETDIGFADGILSQNELAQFCGRSNGRVVTWYDQSGNARHASASSTALQPYCWDEATPNGMYWDNAQSNDNLNTPRLLFQNSAHELQAYKFAAPSTTWSFSTVCGVISNAAMQQIATDGGGFNSSGLYTSNKTGIFNKAAALTVVDPSDDAVINNKNFAFAIQYYSGNTAKAYSNEKEGPITTITNYLNGARSNWMLGSYYAGATRSTTLGLNGFISEHISYNIDIDIKQVQQKQFFDFKINQ